MAQVVLAIGLRDDPHIRAVGLAVREMGGTYFLFDPTDEESVPNLSQANDLLGRLIWPDGRSLSMEQVGSIFCRYAIDNLRPSENLPDLERYGAFEQLQGMLAPLRSIGRAHWINDPWMEARSDCKILQRNLAKSLGLKTPSQIISSDLAEIESFFGLSECVVKPLSDTSLGVTPDEAFCDRSIPTSSFLAPYTVKFEKLLASQIQSDGTPLLVQEKIEKIADLRCMVIDDTVHSFTIPYQEGQPIDFRIAPIGKVELYELSQGTAQHLIDLNRELQVRYSACDLILTQSGDEVFLEANVSGNWLFCDVAGDMGVTRDIARKLTAA